jgi:hypothetical protein
MSVVKISQHDALMIESIRAQGTSDRALLELVRSGNLADLQDSGNGDFDYRELLTFANADLASFEAAILDGYEIKFNTINGIRYLLRVKFGKEVERLTRDEGDYLADVELRTEDLNKLREIVSKYWSITEVKPHEVEGLHHVRIELLQK